MNANIEAMQMATIPIFKAMMPNFSALKPKLMAHIDDLRKNNTGRTVSNMGGWQSNDNLADSENPDIKILLQQFCGFGSACVNNYLSGKAPGPLKPTNGWVNVNPRGAWNAPHMHLPASWSGVIYLDLQDEMFNDSRDGHILFIDPSPQGADVGRDSTMSLKPAEGMLVLFPSYLMHMVAPHQSESERVSIAINFNYGS